MNQPVGKVLVVDVGGTHVKIIVTGETKRRDFDSGPDLTPDRMVATVLKLAGEWEFDAVSIGYPGPVRNNQPAVEPHNLGPGWVNFDYEKAFGRPIKIINDAAMQALGSYAGKKLLFLGFGTGLGAALVVRGFVEPLELAHLPYKRATYEDYAGLRGLKKLGKKKWRKEMVSIIEGFRAALLPEDIVLGGGNAKILKELPEGCRPGDNANAFTGGFRLWETPVETL